MNIEKIFFNSSEKIKTQRLLFIETDYFSPAEKRQYFGFSSNTFIYCIVNGAALVFCNFDGSDSPANTKIYSVEFLNLPAETETETPKQQQQTKLTEILGVQPKKITIEF